MFDAPALTLGRWTDKAVQFRTANNEETVSNAIVHLTITLVPGDYVALGDHSDVTNPQTLAGVYRVRQFQRTTDLGSVQEVKKALL